MTIAEVQKWNQIGQRENVEARWATVFCRLLFAGVSALKKPIRLLRQGIITLGAFLVLARNAVMREHVAKERRGLYVEH